MNVIWGPALDARAAAAREALRCCRACQRRCGSDRLAGGGDGCGVSAATRCFKRHISFAEEVELLPSYMVYFAGCNLRCDFCIQAPAAWEEAGEVVEAERYARIFERAIARGCRTINLVGGEPALHAHTIMAIAAAARRPLPLVLNTNLYMSEETVALLEGVYSLCLADFKFGNDRCAETLGRAARYEYVVGRNLKAVGAERLLVRHLMLPGHLECCTRPVMDWMGKNLPGASFHLMGTYVAGGGGDDRLVAPEEFEQAREYMQRSGLAYHAAKFAQL